MQENSITYVIAALLSPLMFIVAPLVIDERGPRGTLDRDDTRIERVVDLELPTL